MSDVISYSNNYKNLVAGSVNERNGFFDFSTGVVNIVGNHLKGPELNISLSFDHFKSIDMGLGEGLKFSLPFFDCTKAILHTDQGVSVKLSDRNLAKPIEACLSNFQITDNGSLLLVKYHDGSVDEFKKTPKADYAFLAKRRDSAGNALHLDWNGTKLERIVDDNNVEYLSIGSKSSSRGRELTLLSGRYYLYTYINSRFEKIEVSTPYFQQSQYRDQPKYKLSVRFSTNVKYHLIDSITSPNGALQSVEHGERSGEALNDYRGNLMAVVKQHSIEFNGKTLKRTTYDFKPSVDDSSDYQYRKDYNAYGYKATISNTRGSDPTYSIIKPYFYKVIVTEKDHDNNESVVECIYDKFHNLREQKKTYKGCTQAEIYHYYLNDDNDISVQEGRFKLANKIEKTYSDRTKATFTETYEYDYDEFGNVLHEIDHVHNVRIDYEYYDTRADAVEGCPKYEDFVFFLKKQSVTDLNASDGEPNTREVSVRKYTAINDAIYLQSDSSPYSHTSIEFDYYPTGVHQGRLLSRQVMKNDQQCTKQAFEYQDGDSTLFVKGITSADSLPGEQSYILLELDQYTGQKLLVNDSGSIVKMEYYPDGRLKKEISSPNSVHECAREYEYFDEQSMTLMRDQFNNLKRSYFDGLGNMTEIQITVPNVVSDFVVEQREYNSLGQKISQTMIDITLKATQTGASVQNRTWKLKTKYEYDGWMNVSRTIQPDGTVQISDFNPITQTTLSGFEGKGYQQTQVISATRKQIDKTFDKNDQLLTHSEVTFDMFENPSVRWDSFGVTTNYHYDVLDRIAKTKTSYIDAEEKPREVVKDIVYAPYQVGTECVKSIAINQALLGENDYDAFSRLRQQTVNNSISTLSYLPGSMQHYQVTCPDGTVLDTDYDPEFNLYKKTGSKVQTPGLRGLIEKAHDEETGSSVEYTHRFDGLVKSESIDGVTNGYDYTLLGKLLASSVAGGNCDIVTYDDFQRIATVDDGMNVAQYLDFDAFSRPQRVEIAGVTPTTIQYDYSGLPNVMVTTTEQGQDVLQEIEHYTKDGLVENKVTRLGSQELVESFEYDAMRRLVNYSASGSSELLPKDEIGKTILQQHFIFDDFGNVCEVISEMQDQTSNTSLYGYNPDYPTQLYSIEHSNPAYTNVNFEGKYNVHGALTEDQEGRQLRYNQYGELVRVFNAQMQELTSYEYDVAGRMSRQNIPNQPAIEYRYANDNLVYIQQGDLGVSHSLVDGRMVSKRFKTLNQELITDYLCNTSNSPLKVKRGDGSDQLYTYMPYGFRM